MKNLWLALILTLMSTVATAAQNYPHIKTFGFDYTDTEDTATLTWLATHHDAVVGIVDYAIGKVNETQYDGLRAANPNVKILAYIVNTAYTTAGFEDMVVNYATDNSLDPETIYIHYYYDTPVRIRSSVAKTTGTGTPSDRICDASGTLLSDGAYGTYFLALGFGGGTAATLQDARSYQYWNAGWEPKVNHLSTTFQGGYKEWAKYLATVATGKYLSGLMVDTYDGPVDSIFQPSMHNLIELRDAGHATSDADARTYYSQQMALYFGELLTYLKAQTGVADFIISPNAAEFAYIYTYSKVALEDQMGPGKIENMTVEYTTSPSKSTYWVANSYFKKFFEDIDDESMDAFCQMDTAWYHYGVGIPAIGGKQFMIGSMYLFNHPDAYFAIHYGTASYYDTTSTFAQTHWDTMMEFDVGVPVVRTSADWWGVSNTDRMYLVEQVVGTRYVLARDYTKAKVLVRFEASNNNTATDLGTDPQVYALGGDYQRLLETGECDESVVTSVTLGKSEGAIMILPAYCGGGPPPVCDFGHPSLCPSEVTCEAVSGLYWCNSACQVGECSPLAPAGAASLTGSQAASTAGSQGAAIQ